MKVNYIPKSALHISVLLFLSGILFLNAQKEALVTTEIDSVLNLLDQELKKEKYTSVSFVIDSLKKTKAYKQHKFDRLAIDLRRAQILYKLDKCEKSIYLLLDGIKELKQHQDSRIYWMYNLNLGEKFKNDEVYNKAIDYYNIAINNATKRKDTPDIAKSYLKKISVILNKRESIIDDSDPDRIHFLDSIIYYSDKIIKFPLNKNNEAYIAKAYGHLSYVQVRKNNVLLSKKYIEKSLAIKNRLKDTLSLAIGVMNYGNVFYIQKNYKEAIKEYQKGYELIKNNHLKKSIGAKGGAFQNISWSYNELGEYKKAYEYQEMATELFDSLTILNHTRNIAAIESKYIEVQKTEIEKNKRLKSQIFFYNLVFFTFLLILFGYLFYKRLKNKQLKTESKISKLKFKALNAQMNPHFINNLLTSIHYDLINNNEGEMAIINLEKFNNLTNLVLRSTKSNLISLKDEITILKLYLDLQLVRFNNKFEYIVNIDKLSKKDLKAIHIPPLILQPLVENSIVHGGLFSTIESKGKITIDFNFKDDDYLSCTITDNGHSTSKTLQSKVYNGSGISLKNITERLQLIDDNKKNEELLSFISIKNKINDIIGSKTELNIPLIYN